MSSVDDHLWISNCFAIRFNDRFWHSNHFNSKIKLFFCDVRSYFIRFFVFHQFVDIFVPNILFYCSNDQWSMKLRFMFIFFFSYLLNDFCLLLLFYIVVTYRSVSELCFFSFFCLLPTRNNCYKPRSEEIYGNQEKKLLFTLWLSTLFWCLVFFSRLSRGNFYLEWFQFVVSLRKKKIICHWVNYEQH